MSEKANEKEIDEYFTSKLPLSKNIMSKQTMDHLRDIVEDMEANIEFFVHASGEYHKKVLTATTRIHKKLKSLLEE